MSKKNYSVLFSDSKKSDKVFRESLGDYPFSCLDCVLFNILKHNCSIRFESSDFSSPCVFFILLPFPNIEEL